MFLLVTESVASSCLGSGESEYEERLGRHVCVINSDTVLGFNLQEFFETNISEELIAGVSCVVTSRFAGDASETLYHI